MMARWIGLDTFLCGIGMIIASIVGIVLSRYHSFVRYFCPSRQRLSSISSPTWYFTAIVSGLLLLRLEKHIAMYNICQSIAYAPQIFWIRGRNLFDFYMACGSNGSGKIHTPWHDSFCGFGTV